LTNALPPSQLAKLVLYRHQVWSPGGIFWRSIVAEPVRSTGVTVRSGAIVIRTTLV